MNKLIKLDKDYNIKLKSKSQDFNYVSKIYIPIENEIFTKKYIFKEELIESYFSPISGKIIGYQRCLLANNSYTNALVIENDYLEKKKTRTPARRCIFNLTKEEVLNIVKNNYLYNCLNKNNIKNIIISGIDEEAYIANEIFISKENTKEMLETIDFLVKLYKAHNAILAIKNIDSENINSYSNYIGTYKNIKLTLLEDLYLIGKEENLIRYLNIKESYLYLKISDIYNIYNLVKMRKEIIEKYITITGDYIDNPCVFKVKMGTRVKELLNEYYKDINYKECDVYVNGILGGSILDIDELIVDDSFIGLVIMKKKNIKSYNCINCGKCSSVCPMNSEPFKVLTGKKVLCNDCGLCTYICPAYINLKKYLRRANNE